MAEPDENPTNPRQAVLERIDARLEPLRKIGGYHTIVAAAVKGAFHELLFFVPPGPTENPDEEQPEASAAPAEEAPPAPVVAPETGGADAGEDPLAEPEPFL